MVRLGHRGSEAVQRHKRLGPIAAFVLAIVLFAAIPYQVSYAAPTPPPYTTSYYMNTVNPSTLYNLGCTLGQHDHDLAGTQDDIVVLDFGRPDYSGGYGTRLFSNVFASTSQVAVAVEQFGYGYWYCTGSDTTSQLRLAAGTNNSGAYVTSGHGTAWAQMVNTIGSWMSSHGYNTQVTSAAASDMELDYNSATTTRAWVDGYKSAYTWVLL